MGGFLAAEGKSFLGNPGERWVKSSWRKEEFLLQELGQRQRGPGLCLGVRSSSGAGKGQAVGPAGIGNCEGQQLPQLSVGAAVGRG